MNGFSIPCVLANKTSTIFSFVRTLRNRAERFASSSVSVLFAPMSQHDELALSNSTDSVASDPAHLFSLGRVRCEFGPHGATVEAVVSPALRWTTSTVAIKILPFGGSSAVTLYDVVESLRLRVRSPHLVKMWGVWQVSAAETWLVSDLHSGSVSDLFESALSSDVESVLSFVLRSALQGLHYMHDELKQVHGDLKPSNILIAADGSILLADYGVYHVLAGALSGRRSYPGASMWPAPELTESSSSAYDKRADIFALGITALELLEGGAAVIRARRSRARMPRLSNPTQWSASLCDFVGQALTPDPRRRPSASELLRHRFVSGATDTAFRASLEVMQAVVPRQKLYDADDLVANLYRRNTKCVRVPLISIDDINCDAFTLEQHSHKQGSTGRSTFESSLHACVAESMRSKQASVTDDRKEHTSARLALWLDTVHMRSYF